MKSNLILLVIGLALTTACSRDSGSSGEPESSNYRVPMAPVSMDKNDYPVFPDADAGADPAVSDEEGGKGFTGQGWETNTDFGLIGDPHAVKGGMFREVVADFPSTLRPNGPNVTAYSAMISGLVYETLLGLHPTTLEYIPALASHWQISEDKLTYRFRIDPNARWADGMPVVAEDVVASWELWMDKGMNDPSLPVTFGKFKKPVAEGKYIVRVETITPNWRNFLYLTNSLIVLPAHVLKTIDGATYIRDYNYKMVPGSGPYAVDEADVDKGSTIRIRHREDFWGENYRRNVGTSNFDEILVSVVRDRNLEFEMFKRGDLDYYYVNRAQMWEEDLNFHDVERGVILKRRIWNHSPNSIQGFGFNTRRAPYDDIRVRKAIRLLFNREQLIEKLMYGAYQPSNSTHPGSIWENSENEQISYDPQKALALLAEAGYTGRDAQGRLTRNGTPLNLDLLYGNKSSEQFMTVFQEDLRSVGITLNLRLVTFETLIKLLDERQFDMVAAAYTGIIFPNPETSLLSSLADENNTNNITGFKNARVDELIAQYDVAYEVPDRVKIIREIDKIFTDSHHWVLEWYAPYARVAYWNKFGVPQGHITRIGDYRDIVSMWWVDPDKLDRLERARRDEALDLGQGEVEDKYWLDFSQMEELQ